MIQALRTALAAMLNVVIAHKLDGAPGTDRNEKVQNAKDLLVKTEGMTDDLEGYEPLKPDESKDELLKALEPFTFAASDDMAEFEDTEGEMTSVLVCNADVLKAREAYIKYSPALILSKGSDPV